MIVYTPPDNIALRDRTLKSLFLAGTIDNGNSVDWQAEFIERFKDDEINVFNPRRKDWNSSLEQSSKDLLLYQQVMWELQALEQADFILINLLPDSKSPITLLELGLHAKSGKLIVICPESFYRAGNVEIICQYYNIPLLRSIEEFIKIANFV